MKRTWEIALYGKGGIGKSTISANLSAALAESGRRVLQIGCDPKHDSTRLLMGGRELPTVLSYLRETPPEEISVRALLGEGYGGVGCIEAGGPRPGVGCAGRGIISAFEFLEKNHVKEQYDIVLYDVLGDVVCGGFAVPVRREYADAVFLVTSGEFMALYAANNILRGIYNYDTDRYRRVAGVIHNARNVDGEERRVEAFARAVGLPVAARIPRSDLFTRAEERRCVLAALEEPSDVKDIFGRLAGQIGPDMPLFPARPLSDEELEKRVLDAGRLFVHMPDADKEVPERREAERAGDQSAPAAPADGQGEAETAPRRGEHSVPVSRAPLYGCAFNGALTTAVHVTDAIVIAHAPRACAFYTWQNISSPGRKNLFNRGILMPSAISPHFTASMMDEHDVVFGGMDALRGSVRRALEKKPGAVIVVSSCVSGIIGDDVLSVEEMSTPQTPVIVTAADGVIGGDYMTGIEMCLHRIADRLVDRSADIRPGQKSVNIIGETGVSNNTQVNFEIIRDLLSDLGIAVGCRFPGDASAGEIRALRSAPLNILASDSPDNLKLRGWLEERFGIRFYEGTLPVGFRQTEDFLRRMGDFFDCGERARAVTEQEREKYVRRIRALRPILQGKLVMMTTINANADWLLDAAEDAGMQFVWIGVLNYLRQEVRVTDRADRAGIVEEIRDFPAARDKIRELRPDIVLSNYTASPPPGDFLADTMPMTTRVGADSALEILERWARLLGQGPAPAEGEWVHDRKLFQTIGA